MNLATNPKIIRSAILVTGLAFAGWAGWITHHTLKLDDRVRGATLADGRTDPFAGIVRGSDAIRLRDFGGDGFLEIGRYNHGWTLMTPYRLEMHPSDEFSVSCYGNGCLPRFQVRSIGDVEAAVWINGNNIIGSQFGPLKFAFGSFNDGGTEVGRFEKNGNLVLRHDLLLENTSLKARLADLESRIRILEKGD